MTDNLPTNWTEELAKHAKEVASLERPALSQISTKAGVMTYQGQAIPGNKLTCIIVASAFENRWYKERYDASKRSAPNCFALSLTGDEMVPSEESKDKQADSCERCELFAWGSDPNGGKGKACKSVRRLGLIPSGSLKEGANVLAAEVALLSVPVTSAKNWATYVSGVSVQYSRPYWAVLTEIAIAPDPRSQFKISFTTVGMVEEGSFSALLKKIEAVNEILLTPYDSSGEIDGTYPGEQKGTEQKKRKF